MNGLELKYFILKPKGHTVYHHASRVAMRAYAKSIKKENWGLAKELTAWANQEQDLARPR